MYTIRVDYRREAANAVRAFVSDHPELSVLGKDEKDATEKLVKIIEYQYKEKAAEIVLVTASSGEPLTNEQLRQLAKKHPPPQSWFEETQEVL